MTCAIPLCDSPARAGLCLECRRSGAALTVGHDVDAIEDDWRDLPEPWEGYQVSRSGKVRSYRAGVYRLLSPWIASGYWMVSLGRRPNCRQLVHRLVATAFCPRPEGAEVVHHINSDPLDPRAVNLMWCTQAENLSFRGQSSHVEEAFYYE